MQRNRYIGLDIGSTTVKIAIIDDFNTIVHKHYQRHYSNIKQTAVEMLRKIMGELKGCRIHMNITGSGGIDIAKVLQVEFIQEVIASSKAVGILIPDTDVAIELGGEDAKITYFGESVEQRMNGTCAGGTGAFIDQMAVLLQTDSEGLNELAKGAKQVYPIASRCGVFAKTDIQPLLNEGAAKADVAKSVLQAIVNQTLTGLAQGRPIRGRVAFLGGPLTFSSQLRDCFISTLNLASDAVRFPEDAQYFVALGAAYSAKDGQYIDGNVLERNIENIPNLGSGQKNAMKPLFASKEEYMKFRDRHDKNAVKRGLLENYHGKSYLGIDAGSTTTKLALIGEDGEVLFSHYGSNQGSPLHSVVNAIDELYESLPEGVVIAGSTVTGYGEGLIQKALGIDHGEIETIAHYKAARYFEPEVDFILDIGGQDMKSLKVKDGVVHSIMLNEACSSGCGSFIETFAHSMEHDIHSFAKKAVRSEAPVDLGTRCTVFMNSKVKEAQKEGYEVEDIAAGIAVSVVKNALFKVIRMKDPSKLGNKIVVQGGTFYNDSVLRAMEVIAGKNVIRPDIAGIMGAFGAALIAKERCVGKPRSAMLSKEALGGFTLETKHVRCKLCPNHCLMTVSVFSDGGKYVSGNRCERGAGVENGNKNKLPNLYKYKYDRIFDYEPLKQEEAHRGNIGIPRVLNIYEDYPFWHTLFTDLGYRVQLSTRSSKSVYEKGMESIPSDSICYPAKLVHGHIEDLVEKGIKKIFYPSIPYNRSEDEKAGNHYNCPIVTSYSETVRVNMDCLEEETITYINPFLPIYDEKRMVKRIVETFEFDGVTKGEVEKAVHKAYMALDKYQEDVRAEGQRALATVKELGAKAVVLAGRPYHIDPEINHGLPEMIESLGLAIISEDAVSHLAEIQRPLRVVDQWVYHTRLYAAATFVSEHPDLELVQLNSFGCGLDAVTIDQVEEILTCRGKLHTVIKIDEINNLGAARIRMRSLIASINERKINGVEPNVEARSNERVLFTKEMKKVHTILSPQMSPIHFELLEEGFLREGYKLEVLKKAEKSAIDEGLKYVNNDACYPAIITIGQLIEALKSGKYDLDNTSVIISQTGGGCRATNYIAFLRKALKDADLEHIPVISLGLTNLEKNSGFKFNLKLIKVLMRAAILGDVLMRVLYRMRPYEKIEGAANALYEQWLQQGKIVIRNGSKRQFDEVVGKVVQAFDRLEIDENLRKPKVGIVGEILVKYHPEANNDVVSILEAEGAEVVMPDFVDFFLYTLHNSTFRYKELAGRHRDKVYGDMGIRYIESLRKNMKKALDESVHFEAPKSIREIAKGAEKHLSIGHQTGEGWFLTGEMVELIESGVNNVFCLQPFGCLPNHIVGKGMIKELRKSYPKANIVPIDYDPGVSEVNQVNRIKLMLSVAKQALEEECRENVI